MERMEWTFWDEFIDDAPIPSFTTPFTATEEDFMVVKLPIDCHDTIEEYVWPPLCCQSPDIVVGEPRDESCPPNSAQSITNTNYTHSSPQSFDTVEDLFACSSDVEYKGLRLVHLLVACAEAISKEAHDLVHILLCRLRYLVCPTGTTIERVGFYLFHSLQSYYSPDGHMKALDLTPPNAQHHFLGAFRLLHQVYPYIRIAHFTANQSILEALLNTGNNNYSRSIHIIDFDIMEGLQWPPLMEAIRNTDIEIDHLRITAIKWDMNYDSLLFSSCRDTGKRLLEYANSVGIPFSFDEMDLKSMNECVKENQEYEIVAVNCMWELPHMSARSKLQVTEFLHRVRQLDPHILTFGAGPHGIETEDFIERFSHCLQSLCAVVDSLEAGLPEHGLARAMVERIFFVPKICTMIKQADDDEHKCGILKAHDNIPFICGFGGGVISKENIMDANALISSQEGGCYGIELVGHHQLNLKWGSTPLVCVSTWELP
eukprot:Gb_26656 [translate_table: standard]